MLGVTRILAWIMFAVAVALFGAELLRLLQSGYYSSMTPGGLWQALHGQSYFRTAEWTDSYAPLLWDPVLASLLEAPSWTILVIGLVLFGLAAALRRRRG